MAFIALSFKVAFMIKPQYTKYEVAIIKRQIPNIKFQIPIIGKLMMTLLEFRI